MKSINNYIKYNPNYFSHAKASERYVDVEFFYEDNTFSGWIPIEYRRTGLNLVSEKEVEDYLMEIYPLLNPNKKEDWLKEQEIFWATYKSSAHETKSIFDAIKNGEWTCINCAVSNPNWARRYQDLKE